MSFKRSVVSVCVASAVVLFANYPASAQDMKAQKIANVTYQTVEFIKFKEGSRDRAGEIVEKYFAPASANSKTMMPNEYHMQTGEWDYILIWPMAGGMADMEWQTSPDEVAWFGALNKLSGGEAQSKALIAEWNGLIARRISAISHHHNPKK